MRFLLIMMFYTLTLHSYLLDNKLPKETTQLIDSFECFSKDDKTIIYAYILAHKYRMNHIDDRDALVKGDLDYWRLWHLVSDLEYKCKLNYQFSHIVEETILQTEEDKKIHKRLARLEGSINTDGTSESSARMRKYDKKLRQRILDNPPQYTVLKKSKNMEDYNLKPLKDYKPYTIPKNIYEQIEKKKITPQQKDILFRDAYLAEEMIRSYDKPKLRHKFYQEMLYLDECKKMDGYYLRMDFYPNFKRKLSQRVVTSGNGYYPLKTEFLPKEVESYCEHNITKMKLSTFVPKKEKKSKKKVKKIVAKLENLKTFLSQFDNNTTKKKYANEYLSLMKKLLESPSGGTPNVESLKLLRLKNCLVANNDKDDFALIMARVKDFRLEGLKETFYTNIFNSQRWWFMTIRMNIEAEGESKELKDFFNCSSTNNTIFKTSPKVSKNKNIEAIRKHNALKEKISTAGWQKRELIKYFCGVFDGKSAHNLNNKEAIKVGMIPKKFISKSGEIIPSIGKKLTITGMPKGGVSIAYEGLSKGEECEGMLEFLNMDETIFFNKKTYRGIDYVTVNGTQIMLDNFSTEYGKKLCSLQESNKIAYVMENNVSIQKYDDIKEYKSIYHNIERKKVLSHLKRKPNVLALNSTHIYMMSENKTKLYSLPNDDLLTVLPDTFKYSYNVILSDDGKFVSAYKYKKIHQYDVELKVSKEIATLKASPKSYFMNNKMMALFGNKKVLFLDIATGKIVGELQPKFIDPKREFFTPRLKSIALTKDARDLYVLSDKGVMEHWSIKINSSEMKMKYIDNTNADGKLISSFIINPNNENQLLLTTRRDTIEIRNRKNYVLEQILKADRRMSVDSIQISRDNKYLLSNGFRYVYVWGIKKKKLIDVIGSNKNEIYGAKFMPNNSNQILIIGKTKELWNIK